MIAHRFVNIDITKVTVKNYKQTLSKSLQLQVEMFMPPEGSFDDGCLKRYLENVKNYEEEDANSNMTLANRLRIAFQDMKADTICVAEYLIRSGEFNKVRDKDGKLVKKRGILGKMVVLYQPMPKLLESLTRQGLLKK